MKKGSFFIRTVK